MTFNGTEVVSYMALAINLTCVYFNTRHSLRLHREERALRSRQAEVDIMLREGNLALAALKGRLGAELHARARAEGAPS